MIQLTECDGKAYPLAFDWEGEDGRSRIKIDKVCSCTPCAEQKSGVVGDRYECLIGGQREYLYYSLISPRKWFKLKPVSEEEYKAYYRLPGEASGGADGEASNPGYAKDRKLRRDRGMKIAEDPAAYGADSGAVDGDGRGGGGAVSGGDGGGGGGVLDGVHPLHAIDGPFTPV